MKYKLIEDFSSRLRELFTLNLIEARAEYNKTPAKSPELPVKRILNSDRHNDKEHLTRNYYKPISKIIQLKS